MKLSQENARRLSALVWRERLRRFAPIVLAVVVLTGLLTVFLVRQIDRADRTVTVAVHNATVVAVKQGGGARAAIVHVHLDDGREVDAFSALRLTPFAGTHVVINEALHASGKHTFDVVRFAE
jgi:hypothetical protein